MQAGWAGQGEVGPAAVRQPVLSPAAADVDGPQPGPSRGPVRRSLVAYAVTVLVLVALNFFLPRAMPGDPLRALADPTATTYVPDAATRAALERYYGLDQPLAVQFAHYLTGLARGDLGTSIRYGGPVAGLLLERLPWTLLLVVSALLLGAALGLPAGIHSGWRRGRPVDRGLIVGFLAVRSLPTFFLASLAVYLFGAKLGWVPLAGARTPFATGVTPVGAVLDVLHHLLLPAMVLAVHFAAGHYLLMRAGMVAEHGSGHLQLGRVEGLAERRLKYGYAGRTALLPVVTLLGLQFGFAVTGSIFVETVFAYPGVGRLVFDAVAYRDYPTLQGCFLVLSLLVVVANLVVDLTYRRLDPRTAT